MGFLEAVVLGITQGISEFLPISSDGHLIIVPALMGWRRFGLGFDVMLHAATLLATVIYFRHDVARLATALVSRGERTAEQAADNRLAWLLVIATLPSVAIALAFESAVDRVESLPMAVQASVAGGFLLVTACTLGLAEVAAKRWPGTDEHIPLWKGLLVGVAQGFAIAPGLSRSGTTIAAGIGLGVDREKAARFSFLLSIPIVAAAVAKKVLLDVWLGGASLPPPGVSLVALAATTLVGYLAISFLLPFVKRHSLWWFAAYTALMGFAMLVL